MPVTSLAPGAHFSLWEAPHCFLFLRYLNNKVFVSLANGELVVYQREAGMVPTHLPLPTGGN